MSKSEQNLFEHYLKEDILSAVESNNIELVNIIKHNFGKIYFNKIIYYPQQAEIIYSLKFGTNVSFCKYRLEFVNSVPQLTDYYSFKEGAWYSSKIYDMLKLSSKYMGSSEERHQTNRSILKAQRLLGYSNLLDSQAALESLYEVPNSHMLGNGLSLRRIHLASDLGDSTLSESLYLEVKANPSLYIRYLACYYYHDSVAINSIVQELEDDLGYPTLYRIL